MEFRKYKLGDIATFSQGKQVDLNQQYEKEKENMKRFVRIVDYTNNDEPVRYVEDYGDRYYASENELVMIRYGSQTAGMAVMGKNGIIANNMFKINLNNDVALNKYMYYYLSQKKFFEYLRNSQSSSTMPAISFSIMNNMEIMLPEIKNQKKTIDILSSIEKKIELNNQINDNLLKLNNQLYEEYFINNINENADEISLKDLIKVVNGYSYKGSELTDESDIGLATIKNFERKGGFKEDGFKPLNPQKIKEEQIVEKNDILVACTDLTQQADIIGNAVLLLGKAEYEKVIISMDLVKIIPKENIDKYVIFSILNSRGFKNFALGYKSGTTVLHLNKKCFDDFIIKLPANDKLDIFSKMVKTNYEKISNILKENRRLEKLRDTLLPKLMNGEIDIDKIEI